MFISSCLTAGPIGKFCFPNRRPVKEEEPKIHRRRVQSFAPCNFESFIIWERKILSGSRWLTNYRALRCRQVSWRNKRRRTFCCWYRDKSSLLEALTHNTFCVPRCNTRRRREFDQFYSPLPKKDVSGFTNDVNTLWAHMVFERRFQANRCPRVFTWPPTRCTE